MTTEQDKATTSHDGDMDAPSPRSKGNGGRRRAGMVLLVLFVVIAVIGLRWFIHGMTHISTDNAFVESHVHAISSRVPGTVAFVHVRDNQPVKMGDLLVELDPADYRTRVSEASAALAMARNETSGDYAQVEAARAAVDHARARLAQADLDLARGAALVAKEVIPREQFDRLETAKRVAAAQVREAEEQLRKARAEIGLSGSGSREARVALRESQLATASLNLSYTRIHAPADGYITRKSVEAGNTVQAGQPLMAVVSLDDVWITANYKESQLTRMKPNQKVTFTVDAYPGRTFTGTVDSIMAGTGAAFSLLPPENATGNYVKVVQRVPVKIVVDRASDPGHLLRVGMSVVPSVDVERSLGDILHGLRRF